MKKVMVLLVVSLCVAGGRIPAGPAPCSQDQSSQRCHSDFSSWVGSSRFLSMDPGSLCQLQSLDLLPQQEMETLDLTTGDAMVAL